MKAIYSTTTPTIVLCTPSIFQSLLFFRHTKKNIFIAVGAYQSSMQKNCWTTNLVFVKLTLGFIFSSICSMSLFIVLKCMNIRKTECSSIENLLWNYKYWHGMQNMARLQFRLLGSENYFHLKWISLFNVHFWSW